MQVLILSYLSIDILLCLFQSDVHVTVQACQHTWTQRNPHHHDVIGFNLEALSIRKSASQCGNCAWLPCIAALDDCHDVMFINCAMKNVSVDAKNTIGLHLKFSSLKSKVKNSHFCARFWEAWGVKAWRRRERKRKRKGERNGERDRLLIPFHVLSPSFTHPCHAKQASWGRKGGGGGFFRFALGCSNHWAMNHLPWAYSTDRRDWIRRKTILFRRTFGPHGLHQQY